MNANHRACIERRMSHGQFYNADKLVKVIYQDLGRFHLGARVVHAKDRIYAGKFIITPAAQTLSRAANFQGSAVKVTMSLSAASGDPDVTSTVTVVMATQLHLPNGTVIDSAGIILPAFYSASSGAPEVFNSTSAPVLSWPRLAVCATAKRSTFRGSRPCTTPR